MRASVRKERSLLDHEERARACLGRRLEHVFELGGTTHTHGVKLNTEWHACAFHLSEDVCRHRIG